MVYLKLYADHFSKRKADFSLGEVLKVYESKNLKVAGTSKNCLLYFFFIQYNLFINFFSLRDSVLNLINLPNWSFAKLPLVQRYGLKAHWNP